MLKIKYLTLAAVLLALAGCNKELAPEGSEMTVEACVSAPTKVSAAGDAFTAGDQIAVYAWLGGATQMPATRVVDRVVNTFDGTSWTPATMMRWQVTDDPHYFLGVSPAPAAAIADFTAVPYTLDPTNYAASDLLLATTPDGVKNTGVAVPLEFRHAMAKLSVNLKFRSQWATTPDVSAVTVTAQSTANVNYLTQTVTATGVASAVTVPEVVSVASGYDRSFSGLQVPQTGVRKITVTIDGKEFIYEAGEDITLTSGRNTTLNLTVGRDKIELDGISLASWIAESPLSEGEAVSANRYMGHGYVDLGLPSGLKWATCNVGADNPWDYGDYFAWGETEPYYSSQEPLVWKDGKGSGYVWSSYFDTSDGGNTFTKYTKDKKTVLEAIDDAATSNWGKVSVNNLKTIETVIWQNPGGLGNINWDGKYRFARAGYETGEEICVVPADQWEKMKTSTFYVIFKEPGAQIRITTGWWSTTWTSDDIFVGNERVTQNEDGTFTLAVTLAGNPILDAIDEQHLLLSGGGYTPLKLYFAEQVAPWRMPTDAEWTELRTKCTWTWTTRNGVKGYLVSNNGNSIFLPATGYRCESISSDVGSYGSYWSSSLDTGSPHDAWIVNFNSNGVFKSGSLRYSGKSVRPVSAF